MEKCCEIIIESATSLQRIGGAILKDIKEGNRKETNAGLVVATVNSWNALPNKCVKCVKKIEFMQNTIKNIQLNRGYEYKFNNSNKD